MLETLSAWSTKMRFIDDSLRIILKTRGCNVLSFSKIFNTSSGRKKARFHREKKI
tara:strand:+ start:196 stop:360 length:165 start_codon:yes stop_codon:yes gene_type:complete